MESTLTKILNLNADEQARLFEMLTNNADILTKIVPDIPLVEYLATGKDTSANDQQIIQAYTAWKNKH